MNLNIEAKNLVTVMWHVIEALDRFHHPYGSSYTVDLAARLRPLVAELDRAVLQSRSREEAAEALRDIKPVMHEVSGAATKGEMEIFKDDTLNRYYELETIFRESRYASQTL